MRAFQIAAVIAACVALSACASKHEITSSTPRTVEIKGTAWTLQTIKKHLIWPKPNARSRGGMPRLPRMVAPSQTLGGFSTAFSNYFFPSQADPIIPAALPSPPHSELLEDPAAIWF